MNHYVFGYTLIIYGLLKIIISTLNEVAPKNLRHRLQTIPVFGHLFEDDDTTIARQIFNLCFFIYGVDSLIHGLYLNRIIFTTQPWFLTHTAAYVFHFVLGLFMFATFYTLFDLNESFYVVEGVYSGLILLSMVPIMYMYNNVLSAVEYGLGAIPIGILGYIGYTIMLKNPDRVPNVIDLFLVSLNSLI